MLAGESPFAGLWTGHMGSEVDVRISVLVVFCTMMLLIGKSLLLPVHWTEDLK